MRDSRTMHLMDGFRCCAEESDSFSPIQIGERCRIENDFVQRRRCGRQDVESDTERHSDSIRHHVNALLASVKVSNDALAWPELVK